MSEQTEQTDMFGTPVEKAIRGHSHVKRRPKALTEKLLANCAVCVFQPDCELTFKNKLAKIGCKWYTHHLDPKRTRRQMDWAIQKHEGSLT